MPALQVKDFPADVYDELRSCASNEDRSISQQTIHILRQYLALYKEAPRTSLNPEGAVLDSLRAEVRDITKVKEDRFEKRRQAIQRISELPPIGLPDGYSSIAEMIREDRESRVAFVDSLIEESK